jgi:hypothetical protein
MYDMETYLPYYMEFIAVIERSYEKEVAQM